MKYLISLSKLILCIVVALFFLKCSRNSTAIREKTEMTKDNVLSAAMIKEIINLKKEMDDRFCENKRLYCISVAKTPIGNLLYIRPDITYSKFIDGYTFIDDILVVISNLDYCSRIGLVDSTLVIPFVDSISGYKDGTDMEYEYNFIDKSYRIINKDSLVEINRDSLLNNYKFENSLEIDSSTLIQSPVFSPSLNKEILRKIHLKKGGTISRISEGICSVTIFKSIDSDKCSVQISFLSNIDREGIMGYTFIEDELVVCYSYSDSCSNAIINASKLIQLEDSIPGYSYALKFPRIIFYNSPSSTYDIMENDSLDLLYSLNLK